MAEHVRHLLSIIASWGLPGAAAFVLLYVFFAVTFLPVSVLTFGAGAAFGATEGFFLVWTGAVLGSCVSFLLGRHWLRGWVEKRVARHPLFAAVDAAVSAEGWRVIALTRVAPFFPFTILNYAYGLTRVSLSEYALATAAGMAPGTAVFVSIGATAGEAVKDRARTPAEWALLAAGLVAALAAGAMISRAAKKALEKRVRP